MKDLTKFKIARTARPLLAAALICWSFAAQALMIENFNGIELEASMMSMPSSDSGTMTVRECNECDRIRLNTDAITEYVVRDASGNVVVMSRQDFASQLQLIDNSDALVTVFYEIATNTVTEVRLSSKVSLGAPANNAGGRNGGNGQSNDNQSGNGQSGNTRPANRTGGFR
jgi:hypothetical protein